MHRIGNAITATRKNPKAMILVTVQRFENRIERAVGVSFRRPQNPVSFHGTAAWP
jgi:hypothetical protein